MRVSYKFEIDVCQDKAINEVIDHVLAGRSGSDMSVREIVIAAIDVSSAMYDWISDYDEDTIKHKQDVFIKCKDRSFYNAYCDSGRGRNHFDIVTVWENKTWSVMGDGENRDDIIKLMERLCLDRGDDTKEDDSRIVSEMDFRL